ncbi:MAG: hydrogen peroxide-inducible genes activator [Calditrichaeota bacterium]|nr:MAG: hydrogen peroxide-inducible genes activator [Calditrichota bacterium]
MTLQQLHYIVALDQERNFVKAAQRCFVTQPALTVQVQKLEEELGVVIFDRAKKPLMPTMIGKQLIDQARLIIRETEKMQDIVHDHETEISGELKIGVLPTIGQYLLPLFVNRFIENYPGVYLKVEEGQTGELVEKLKNGTLDAAIYATPVEEKYLVGRVLYYEEMFVFVSADHPFARLKTIEPKSLTVDELWLLSMGNCFRNQVVNICNRDRNAAHDLPFTYESDSIESLKRIVKLQKGLTVIPEMAAWDLSDADKKMLKPFANLTPVREISLVVNRTFLKKKLIDVLHDAVIKALPEHMRALNGRSLIEPY